MQVSEARRLEIDELINKTFYNVTRDDNGGNAHYDKDALDKRSAEAARTIYALTRELGLERQPADQARKWKPSAGIAPNAYSRHYFSGAMREEAEARGWYVPDSFPRRIVTAPKARRTRAPKATRTNCPNCGSTFFVTQEAA